MQADFNLSLAGIAVPDFTAQVQTAFKSAFADAMNVLVSRVVITTINGVAYNKRSVGILL